MTKQERINESRRYAAFMNLPGFTLEEYETLRRDSMRLHRWSEAECNGDIERDDETGKCFRHYGHNGPGPFLTAKMADKETPAKERITALCKRHKLKLEMQGDPKGAAVKITMPDKRDFYFGYGM